MGQGIGLSKICGKQPLKNFSWSVTENVDPDIRLILQ